jgi:hypothetical protein
MALERLHDRCLLVDEHGPTDVAGARLRWS